MARPKKEINVKQVEKLAALQCTLKEIASFFDVDESTISRRFAREMAKGKESGKISLRRNQFNLSKTNAAVCIFLGKNYLGQSDRQEIVQLDVEVPQNVDGLSDKEIDDLLNKLVKKDN